MARHERISATKMVRFDRGAELRQASIDACVVCGEARKRKASFCAGCGHAYEAVRRGTQPYSPARGRPGLGRRILAELIDRLAPLPFIAWFWPEWTLVVVAYHLLCGATPAGRSPGKAVCRLRVISLDSLEPCGRWRAAARRVGVAAFRAMRQRCSSCGEWVLQRSRYCPCCGVGHGNELKTQGAAREPLSWRDSK